MTQAADLIYPLVMHQHHLQRLLRRYDPRVPKEKACGALIVRSIHRLREAEKHARDMTPFDPSGL